MEIRISTSIEDKLYELILAYSIQKLLTIFSILCEINRMNCLPKNLKNAICPGSTSLTDFTITVVMEKNSAETIVSDNPLSDLYQVGLFEELLSFDFSKTLSFLLQFKSVRSKHGLSPPSTNIPFLSLSGVGSGTNWDVLELE